MKSASGNFKTNIFKFKVHLTDRKKIQMPKISKKRDLVNNLCIKYCLDIAAVDSSDEEDEVLDKFYSDLSNIYFNRRTTHFHAPKCSSWRSTVLGQFDEDRVRHMLRVNKQEFLHILHLIKDDAVFTNKNSVPQLPIEQPLEIVLYRFGCSGESSSIKKCASLFGVGDGGTVLNITRRVITAIINLKSRFLVWPSEEERLRLQQKTFHELPGCIAYIDGTEKRLAEAPMNNHELFFSRKRQYSVKLQIVCDYKLRIRQTSIGIPGSYHDARIFAKSAFVTGQQNLFSGSQWMARDSAYPEKPYLLNPFRQNSREYTKEERDNYNKNFSKCGVRIENCIGILKEKFGSLKELRFRYKAINNAECNDWILACCILHNIIIV